jgi:hypothetical protein
MISRLSVLFAFLFLLTTGFISARRENSSPYIAKWVVVSGSSLQVEGSTNVNKFKCEIVNYSKPDTIIVYRNSGNAESLQLTGNLKLNVQSFDCHNPVMTGDLRKTLKVKEHPNLFIKFLTLNKFPSNQQQEVIKGLVDIQLAGVTKRFDVNYKFSKDAQNIVHLIGTRNVNFSDFNLTPPRKLGGMIQTDDQLKVQFRLRMKALD